MNVLIYNCHRAKRNERINDDTGRFFNWISPMRQVHRFYLTEFLKTQRYFIPVMILFLQFNKLNYTEIFFLYAVKSAVILIMEIPSGVMADRMGKKFILILSRSFLLPSYLLFYLGDGFIPFLFAMVFLGMNEAFKSGTHKAYIYDFIKQRKPGVTTTEVFGKGKFWGRIGEAAASLAGGFIAVRYGYHTVFLYALAPVILNMINAWSYESIEEEITAGRAAFSGMLKHVKVSVNEIRDNGKVGKLILNSSLFVIIAETSEIYMQPYMAAVNIPLEWFGMIYTVIFILTAFGSRYAHLTEARISRSALTNLTGWAGIIPLFLLGLKLNTEFIIVLFFILFFIRHIRRPGITSEINDNITSRNRATILSAESFLKSVMSVILLPVIGLVTEAASIYTSLIILAVLMILNQILFGIPRSKEN